MDSVHIYVGLVYSVLKHAIKWYLFVHYERYVEGGDTGIRMQDKRDHTTGVELHCTIQRTITKISPIIHKHSSIELGLLNRL